MQKYYIPEINLRDIRNNTNLLINLEKKFNKTSNKSSIIISRNGYYKYDKDRLLKYKLIENESNIVTNFLKKYSLIGINQYEKKVSEVFSVPFESNNIILEKIKFNVGTSEHYLVIEKKKDRIIDFYFLSTKKIDETCKFFNKDVSSFVEMLMFK
mgnify:CR=1 FL=1|jgi:hypothetical protein|tara:strand:+ start:1705 stop:2169 length:465 start_codon:yes stop_codon:yes gene_type:complete